MWYTLFRKTTKLTLSSLFARKISHEEKDPRFSFAVRPCRREASHSLCCWRLVLSRDIVAAIFEPAGLYDHHPLSHDLQGARSNLPIMAHPEDTPMSCSDQLAGSTFDLPDRSAPQNELSINPSNQNHPDLEKLGLWTKKHYDEIDPAVRESIEGIIDNITGGMDPACAMQRPDNTPGEAISYSSILQILEKAKSDPSNTVRRNLTLVAEGLYAGGSWIDSGTFCDGGCKDPQLNVDSSRGSKFRIIEAILKEAEQLGTKELDSVLYYLDIVLSSMGEQLRCWRIDWQWDDRMGQFGPPHQGYVPTHEEPQQDRFPQ